MEAENAATTQFDQLPKKTSLYNETPRKAHGKNNPTQRNRSGQDLFSHELMPWESAVPARREESGFHSWLISGNGAKGNKKHMSKSTLDLGYSNLLQLLMLELKKYIIHYPPTSWTKKTNKTGWWFQPIWKICSSKWAHLPQIGVKIKNISVATTQKNAHPKVWHHPD